MDDLPLSTIWLFLFLFASQTPNQCNYFLLIIHLAHKWMNSNADLNILREFCYMVPDEEITGWIFPGGWKVSKAAGLVFHRVCSHTWFVNEANNSHDV